MSSSIPSLKVDAYKKIAHLLVNSSESTLEIIEKKFKEEIPVENYTDVCIAIHSMISEGLLMSNDSQIESLLSFYFCSIIMKELKESNKKNKKNKIDFDVNALAALVMYFWLTSLETQIKDDPRRLELIKIRISKDTTRKLLTARDVIENDMIRLRSALKCFAFRCILILSNECDDDGKVKIEKKEIKENDIDSVDQNRKDLEKEKDVKIDKKETEEDLLKTFMSKTPVSLLSGEQSEYDSIIDCFAAENDKKVKITSFIREIAAASEIASEKCSASGLIPNLTAIQSQQNAPASFSSASVGLVMPRPNLIFNCFNNNGVINSGNPGINTVSCLFNGELKYLVVGQVSDLYCLNLPSLPEGGVEGGKEEKKTENGSEEKDVNDTDKKSKETHEVKKFKTLINAAMDMKLSESDTSELLKIIQSDALDKDSGSIIKEKLTPENLVRIAINNFSIASNIMLKHKIFTSSTDSSLLLDEISKNVEIQKEESDKNNKDNNSNKFKEIQLKDYGEILVKCSKILRQYDIARFISLNCKRIEKESNAKDAEFFINNFVETLNLLITPVNTKENKEIYISDNCKAELKTILSKYTKSSKAVELFLVNIKS